MRARLDGPAGIGGDHAPGNQAGGRRRRVLLLRGCVARGWLRAAGSTRPRALCGEQRRQSVPGPSRQDGDRGAEDDRQHQCAQVNLAVPGHHYLYMTCITAKTGRGGLASQSIIDFFIVRASDFFIRPSCPAGPTRSAIRRALLIPGMRSDMPLKMHRRTPR